MAEELVVPADFEHHTQRIDRWNDEGGSMACRTKSEATVSTYGFATPTVAEPAALICRTFAEEESPEMSGSRRHRKMGNASGQDPA